MTCRECELLLAGEIRNGAVEEHLRACPDCCAIAAELRENAVALSAMREEEIALERGLKSPLQAKARSTSNIWIGAAAAAVLVLAFGLSRRPAPIAPPQVARQVVPETPPPLPPLPAKSAWPVRKKPPVPVETAQAEPLLVKMLTPDPDVVIYWLVEPKERSE
jgi:anti-sigma factor RsiW